MRHRTTYRNKRVIFQFQPREPEFSIELDDYRHAVFYRLPDRLEQRFDVSIAIPVIVRHTKISNLDWRRILALGVFRNVSGETVHDQQTLVLQSQIRIQGVHLDDHRIGHERHQIGFAQGRALQTT
ncbi:hypothetical protein D3C84_1032660 [compost metagenome]